jgi:hypothetical protein
VRMRLTQDARSFSICLARQFKCHTHARAGIVRGLLIASLYVRRQFLQPGVRFAGCGHCLQDFSIEVLKSVNASDIADKLQKIHERNEKYHHHHNESEFDEDECITSKDIEDLKPDLAGLEIPNWKEECKEVCTSVLKVLPLAASLSGVLFFVGVLCGILSIVPLCMLCCSCCKGNPQPTQRFHHCQRTAYTAVPGAASPVRPPLLQASAKPR